MAGLALGNGEILSPQYRWLKLLDWLLDVVLSRLFGGGDDTCLQSHPHFLE